MAGKIQNEDIKSASELTGAGGSASQLPNDTKIYVTASSLNKTLYQAITDGNLSGGGGTYAITSKTANYTATTSDKIILCDSSGGTFTITLFAASGNSGKELIIKKTDSSLTAVTIDGNGSETIDGSTTTTLNTKDECIRIVCDGTNWFSIERKIPGYQNTYSPTITATSNPSKASSPDADLAVWSRNGKNMIFKYIYQHTNNAGSAAGSGEYAFSMPSGLTIDTSYIGVSSGGEVLGSAQVQYGSTLYTAEVTYRGSTSDFGIIGNNGGTGFLVGASSTPLNGSTIIYACTAIIPITGWNA